MNHLQTFRVFPNIPDQLRFLETLSRNLWWSWESKANELFRQIDPRLWNAVGRNPISLLAQVPQQRLEGLSGDEGFMAQMAKVQTLFERQTAPFEATTESPFATEDHIAYFSMEFGLHESLPLFAGGLGILAGDHLKAASDLKLPLSGVGLLYHQGYFKQFLDDNGWQQEAYPHTDIYQLPLKRAYNTNGEELIVEVPGPTGLIRAAVWALKVGGIKLYLLDADLQDNPEHIQKITANLYAGDDELRVTQETLLGIGGVKALEAMGIFPNICHLNEGHSAFSHLERLAQICRRYQVDLETAFEIIPRTTVFTTHTPVPAGHDEFPVEMVKPLLQPYEKELGVDLKTIISWGQPPGVKGDTPFSMFILGAHLADYCNGVSRLHGEVARNMWTHLWPGQPTDEIPITHVTNGIHIPSWLSVEHAPLYERYLGPDWYTIPLPLEKLKAIGNIFEEELWRAHEMCRARLIALCRDQMVSQYAKRNAPAGTMAEAASVLEQGVLTIGFARRFATYKRADLLLRDPDRLEAILTNERFPVQFVFAGKAHPKDYEGKAIIQRIVEFSRRPAVKNRIVFLENYDMHIARHMYQGCDVWLNNPRRPMEACGTSGMKAAINGCLNASILDGWWAEAYSPEVGWAIGTGESANGDWSYQDAVDGQALYNLLENNVIPAFYNRHNGATPKEWMQMVKASIKLGLQQYGSMRMVDEYAYRFYLPAAAEFKALVTNNAAKARRLAQSRLHLKTNWPGIRIEPPLQPERSFYRVGDEIELTAVVHLGQLTPDDVVVQIYYGQLKSVGQVMASMVSPMTLIEELGDNSYRYRCTIQSGGSGHYGFTARVVPNGDHWKTNTPGLITWALPIQ